MNVHLKIDGDEIHTLTVTQVPFEYHCTASLLPEADPPLLECAFRVSANLSLGEAYLRWQEYHRAEYREATVALLASELPHMSATERRWWRPSVDERR